jgi:hypothetical protein
MQGQIYSMQKCIKIRFTYEIYNYFEYLKVVEEYEATMKKGTVL